VDRKKEVIKPGGFQVWPREVEEIIQDHPAVQEAAVAGVPDPHRGETVKAWLVLMPGEKIDFDELRNWCGEQMAKYKIPTEFELRDQLPKTHVGKLLRRELVKEHSEQAL
jgi:long-chain acyl-CoA synthetase